ncbi:MAG TPA: hypothetical protein VH619_15835 [Verrucomicrobiae bacterium]|jgi:hypothetical protein|nr:hypothetical protein [Verrucomicrobiae bacterium]
MPNSTTVNDGEKGRGLFRRRVATINKASLTRQRFATLQKCGEGGLLFISKRRIIFPQNHRASAQTGFEFTLSLSSNLKSLSERPFWLHRFTGETFLILPRES